MQDHPVLKTILNKLGLLGPEARRREASRTSEQKRPQAEAQRNLNNFKSRLNKILWQRQTDINDRVYLIGLERVRGKLGAKWESSQHKIHETVVSVIERRLTPNDFCVRYDAERYLVLFGTLGKKEAQLRCSLISQEIIEKIVGPETVSDFMAVNAVTVQDDGEVVLKELPSVRNLFEDMIEHLNRASDRAEGPEQGAPTETVEHAFRGQEDIRFVFRPLLAVRTKVISTFLCVPVRKLDRNRFASGYGVIEAPSNAGDIYSLDTLTLKKASAELSKLVGMGGRSLLALPVHFETLANFDTRRSYLHLCASSFSDHRNRIVFEIVGLSEGIPQSQLFELVSALSRFGRDVIARLLPEHKNFTAFGLAGLHSVGMDVFETEKSEKEIMNEMSEFVFNARKNQLKTFIEGVRSISLFTAAVTTGFDFISGYALSPVLESAEDVHTFKLDMPYLSLLQPVQPAPDSQQES